MTYSVPQPSDLVARFPTFAAVPTTSIAVALAEAATRVDQSWLPDDFTIATLLYAAHIMTLDGLGTGAEAAMAGAGALGFQSMRSGGLSLERRQSGGRLGAARQPEPSILTETTYGRRFLALLAVNQPAVLVA